MPPFVTKPNQTPAARDNQPRIEPVSWFDKARSRLNEVELPLAGSLGDILASLLPSDSPEEFITNMIAPLGMVAKPASKVAGKVTGSLGETLSIGKPTLDAVRRKWSDAGVALDVYESKANPGILTLSKIEVPRSQRGQGIGSAAMKELAQYADANGKTIALTPSTDCGASSVGRLREFYKRLGFTDNKGRTKDFTISESMVRRPTQTAESAPGSLGEMVSKRIPNPIKAYHGSPHDFDQFSMSKIGTGEGAQAYGHGLYFAENEAVAKDYQKALAKRNTGVLLPKYKEPRTPEQNVIDTWLAHTFQGGSKKEATKELSKFRDNLKAKGLPTEDVESALHTIETSSGRTYEVNIHATPDELLDWDKPLSQQPEKVRAALGEFGESPADLRAAIEVYKPRLALGGMRADMAQKEIARLEHQLAQAEMTSGGDFYRRVADTKGGMATSVRDWSGANPASETLNKAGIKGIQYLDQGSRAKGDGTRNFVIFDDELIEIARKYGIPLATAASLVERQGGTVEARQ